MKLLSLSFKKKTSGSLATTDNYRVMEKYISTNNSKLTISQFQSKLERNSEEIPKYSGFEVEN